MPRWSVRLRASVFPSWLPATGAVAFLCALTAVVAACGQGRGVVRTDVFDTLSSPAPAMPVLTLSDVLDVRVPPVPDAPEGISRRVARDDVEAARLAMALGDVDAAEDAWARASRDGRQRSDAAFDRCVSEAVLRRFPDMIDACRAFLTHAPQDPRAPAAARTLVLASPAWGAAGDVVALEGPAWVKACARAEGTCDELAFIVANHGAQASRAPAMRSRFADAVLATGRLRHARIEGPFDGELHAAFVDDRLGKKSEPLALYHRVVFEHDDDGVFAPAEFGVPGLYRLAFTGRGGGPATLFVGGGAALRARVDGTIVAEREHDATVPATTRVAIELMPGDHEVELFVWSGGDDRISVALLGPNGEPALREAKVTTSVSAQILPGGVRVVSAPSVLDKITNVRTGSPDDLEALFRWIAAAALTRPPSVVTGNDDQRSATVLVGTFGWSPLALCAAAEVLDRDGSVPARVASASAARLWERVLDRWPNHPVARLSLARDLRDERPDEALTAYRELVAVQPAYPPGHRDFIALALAHGRVDEARASAHALLALEESFENIRAAVPALRASGESARAAELEKRQVLLDGHDDALQDASVMFRRGETAEAVAILEDAARRDGGVSAAEALVSHSALRDVEGASAILNAALSRWPDDARLVVRHVEMLRMTTGDAAARAALARAMPRVGHLERIQALADALGMQEPWHARFSLGDEVIARRRAMVEPPWPGHGMVALLDDVERVFRPDGSSLLMQHSILELRSKAALDAVGEISPAGFRVARLRVVKSDGTVVEPERHDGVEDLSLPELAPGDIVEILKLRFDDAMRLGGLFETRALNATTVPAVNRSYVVSFPEGFEAAHGVEIVARGAPVERALVNGTDGERRVVVRMALQDVPAQAPESFSASISESAAVGGVAWGVSDAFWARLRGHDVERAAVPTPWLESAAKAIAGSGNDAVRLRRVFDFVVQRIEPNDREDRATVVLATGQGKRTALFLALARAAGLDAAPVAFQFPAQADPTTYDAGSWSVLGVRVRHSGRMSLAIVDGNAVLDALPLAARGARILELTLGAPGPAPMAIPDAALDLRGVHVSADLAVVPSAGVMRGTVVVAIPAAKSDGVRRVLQRMTAEQLRPVLEGALSDSLPGMRVVDVVIPDLERGGGNLHLGARVEVPLPAASEGAVRFEHVFAQGASGGLRLVPPFSAYLTPAERHRPMVVVADREVLELRLALPANASFVEVPPSFERQEGPFVVRQHVEVTDGVLTWRREFATEAARVSVEQWPVVRLGLAGLAARTDARIGFVVAEGRAAESVGDAPDRVKAGQP